MTRLSDAELSNPTNQSRSRYIARDRMTCQTLSTDSAQTVRQLAA